MNLTVLSLVVLALVSSALNGVVLGLGYPDMTTAVLVPSLVIAYGLGRREARAIGVD